MIKEFFLGANLKGIHSGITEVESYPKHTRFDLEMTQKV